MRAALARIALGRDPGWASVARALRPCARGGLPPEERAWSARIESRRRELNESDAEVRPGFALDGAPLPPWAAFFDHSMPLFAPTAFLSIPPIWGAFLLRLVRELSPRSCLELGTGLGISTAYQAAALELNGDGRLLTLDAARDWGEIATEGLAEVGLADRVELRLGAIERSLEDALEAVAPVDFAFVDAEHQEQPTLRYFELMLPRLSRGATVVFDDVGHPREMRRAWRAVCRHPRVAGALALGRMGVARIG
jgi:predicted O-methyltransferase YrrM